MRMIGLLDEPPIHTKVIDNRGHAWIRTIKVWLPFNPADGPGLSWAALNIDRGPLAFALSRYEGMKL